jgi:2'-5' RNA ligase
MLVAMRMMRFSPAWNYSRNFHVANWKSRSNLRFMRLFTAIELPPEIRRAISRWMPPLAEEEWVRRGWFPGDDGLDEGRDQQVKWVAEETLHITLKFFGEVAEQRVAELCDSLKQITAEGPALLWPGPTNCFPNRGPVATIVLDVQGQVDRLERLYEALEAKGCELLGIPKDRWPFHPHITVGRAKPVLPPHVRNGLSQRTMKNQHQFLAAEFVLMQSLLKPDGPQYIPLARFPL